MLDALYYYLDGMTDEELDTAVSDGSDVPTVRPRRIGLGKWIYRDGRKTITSPVEQYHLLSFLIRRPLVEDSSETRLTRFKNKATVWRLTAEGRRVAEARR